MASPLFELSGPRDYFECVEDNVKDFFQNHTDVRRLMNAAISLNHVADWVWHSWLARHPERQRELGVSHITQFYDWINHEESRASLIRKLAKGPPQNNIADLSCIASAAVIDTVHAAVEKSAGPRHPPEVLRVGRGSQ